MTKPLEVTWPKPESTRAIQRFVEGKPVLRDLLVEELLTWLNYETGLFFEPSKG